MEDKNDMVWNKNLNLGYDVTNDILSIYVDATDNCDLLNFIPLNGEELSYDSHTWNVYGHSLLDMIHILNSFQIPPDEDFQEIEVYEIIRNYPKNPKTLRCSFVKHNIIPFVSHLYHR